jgi:hypothetical protein
MTPRRPAWTAALIVLVAWRAPASAADPVPAIPPPGAMPEPVGRPVGYHQRNYGGCKQGTVPSIWADLDYVYRKDMHDVFTYKPWKWRYGYPVGYGIGAGCEAGGPFGTTERCGLTPLHYRAEAPTVFTGPRPELTGASWYRLAPTGPAAGPAPLPTPTPTAPPVPGLVPAPAPQPRGLSLPGSALDR